VPGRCLVGAEGRGAVACRPQGSAGVLGQRRVVAAGGARVAQGGLPVVGEQVDAGARLLPAVALPLQPGGGAAVPLGPRGAGSWP
jgi:hypothetical protein